MNLEDNAILAKQLLDTQKQLDAVRNQVIQINDKYHNEIKLREQYQAQIGAYTNCIELILKNRSYS